MSRYEGYKIRRYYLELSSFAGIVFHASHWWCRIKWDDEDGEYHEADAEHGRGWRNRTGRFDTREAALKAGIKLVRKLAKEHECKYYVATEGGWGYIDPARTISAPGNLKGRLNDLWRKYEKLAGWAAPKAKWPTVQKICDRWSELIKGP